MKNKTYFFVKLRRALAPIIREMLEHCGPLRFFSVKMMSWYLKPVVQWDGHTVFVDTSDFGLSFELESTGEYEVASMEYCKNFLKPGMVFVDVGANIGLFTLMAARQVGPTGHVYSFEPGATNCVLMRKNVEHNGYNNVTIIQKAVLDHSGSCTLFKSGFNTADHRTYCVSKGRKQTTIDCVSLDDYFSPDIHIDMIKMDIEGVEEVAIRGMDRILATKKPLQFIVECWPSVLKKVGTDPFKLFASLEQRGFKLSVIDDASRDITPMDSVSAVEECRQKEVANILCILR
ncbi:FkbM family methyltransferase [Patescibacteria group bacterium]|nr:FkbM family methyltransferase [Patescibacteria group bacterium]